MMVQGFGRMQYAAIPCLLAWAFWRLVTGCLARTGLQPSSAVREPLTTSHCLSAPKHLPGICEVDLEISLKIPAK